MKRIISLLSAFLLITALLAPAATAQTAEEYPPAGTPVVFEARDLKDNPVTSEEIFSGHILTMVNLWGTYCGPCIMEMPELAILSGRLAEKNCAVIGIVIDVGIPGMGTAADAEKILSDAGVTYPNYVLDPAVFMELLPAYYVPTTYFVDGEGKLVGEPLIGARGADEYEQAINALLGE